MGFVHLNGLHDKKEKVIFIMGSTGSGKTKLSVDLATYFNGEVINSDKIQVYKGLDIVTNKATSSEKRGIPHHLLGFIENLDADFTLHEFVHHVQIAINEIGNRNRNRIPIIAGGSNTYIEALVEDPMIGFRLKYDCLFIWLDASLPVLFNHVSKRVDQMVDAGLVDELRAMFVPGANYERGIRRAIGAHEMAGYFLAERLNVDQAKKEILLKDGIRKTKENTCQLAERQVQKIRLLQDKWGIRRVDVTAVYERSGKNAGVAWEGLVLKPCLAMVDEFLKKRW